MKYHKMKFAELIEATGSKKGLDPMPPDQYQKKMDARYSPEARVLAWAQSKTMGRAWPYCVNEHGRDLNIRDAAKELEMDRKLAERTFAHLVAEDWLTLKGYRIYLNGEVDLKPVQKGLNNDSGDCTIPVAPYILKQINKLAPALKQRFWDWQKNREARALLVRRELTAALRVMDEQEEDTFFSEIGLQKKHQKKRRADASRLLPLLQPLIAGIVQSQNGQNGHGTVHTAKAGLSSPENRSVQSLPAAPSLYTETETEKDIPSSSSVVVGAQKTTTTSSFREELRQNQIHEIEKRLSIDHDAAGKLLEATAVVCPDITAREVEALWHMKAAQVIEQIRGGKIANVTGFMIRAIPKMASGELLAYARKKTNDEFNREWEEAQRTLLNPDLDEEFKGEAQRRVEALISERGFQGLLIKWAEEFAARKRAEGAHA